jgi:hypothetical protein
MSAVRSSLRRIAARLPLSALSRLPSALSAPAGDHGMSTAEYAVGTVAACGFAGMLYKILTSSQVLDLVTNIISQALHILL